MAEEKLLKSGQFTLPRLLFLAAVGGVIALFVARGGVWLTVGYLVMTAALCVLLFLIAIDYGVKMEKVDLQGQPLTGPSVPTLGTAQEFKTATSEPRPRRRSTKSPKRRR
jgi:hypothetical protein